MYAGSNLSVLVWLNAHDNVLDVHRSPVCWQVGLCFLFEQQQPSHRPAINLCLETVPEMFGWLQDLQPVWALLSRLLSRGLCLAPFSTKVPAYSHAQHLQPLCFVGVVCHCLELHWLVQMQCAFYGFNNCLSETAALQWHVCPCSPDVILYAGMRAWCRILSVLLHLYCRFLKVSPGKSESWEKIGTAGC